MSSPPPDLPPARALRRAPGPHPAGARWHGRVALAHDERVLRRRRLVTVGGEGFNGPSHFTFQVNGDRVARMTIRA